MIWVLLSILAVLTVFAAILFLRAALFRPKAEAPVEASPCEFDREAATEALRALIRCRTVSRYTAEEEDDAEFERLVSLLPSLYPNVARVCPLLRFDGRALLYRWEGRERGAATVLMAHYDVVPAEDEGWTKPPFEGAIENGYLWGRGTLDTKVTVNGVMFAVNHLIGEGFVPTHDVYLAFSGSEEVAGPGASHIVDYFHDAGIEVALVLDEGGAVVEGAFPGVRRPTAVIGIAEKGMLDLEYRVRASGGHASAPKGTTPITRLSAACVAIEKHPPKMHISAPVRKMFDTLGRHSAFPYRLIFANLRIFSPLLSLIARKNGGELNAMVRTTVAFTRMKGSESNNVLPTEATMVSNIRLSPADSVHDTIAYLRRTIDDKRVELRPIQSINPSRVSCTDCEGYARVTEAVRATWQEAIAAPYLMMQCSDSRHWGAISDRVYRFSAMELTAEERRTIHGQNERIRIDALCRTVEFYIRLLKRS